MPCEGGGEGGGEERSLAPCLEKGGQVGELLSMKYACLLLYKDKNHEVWIFLGNIYFYLFSLFILLKKIASTPNLCA